jgi:hypothetical protein
MNNMYVGTKYAIQDILELEGELPPMINPIPPIPVPPVPPVPTVPTVPEFDFETSPKPPPINFIETRNMPCYQANYEGRNSETSIFWTNDADDSLDKIGIRPGWKSCSNFLTEDKDKTNFYRYNCISLKKCYLMNFPNIERNNILSNINFKLKPVYGSTPQEFIHRGVMFGHEKNLFNMYLSYHLAVHLETEVIRWISTIPVIPNKDGLILNINARRNGPALGQILTTYSRDIQDDKKLHMLVRPEYLYWTVETLVRNYGLLIDKGLLMFKFLFLVGENKMIEFTEICPGLNEGDVVETYKHEGKEYKREELNMANIVFYLKGKLVVKELIDELYRLFPDEYDISNGKVPRFNMRLSDNLFFSVGGNNQTKYDHSSEYLPREYDIILKSSGLRHSHAIWSRYLTGTDICVNGEENNIRSYLRIIPADSFRDTFNRNGLIEYYDRSFQKLKLPEITMTGGRQSRRKNKSKKRKSKKRFN